MENTYKLNAISILNSVAAANTFNGISNETALKANKKIEILMNELFPNTKSEAVCVVEVKGVKEFTNDLNKIIEMIENIKSPIVSIMPIK